jgi:ArsR family metal-binding transcriptional regulator
MKLCKKCGEELEDNAKFCGKCGEPQTDDKKETLAVPGDGASVKAAPKKVKKPSAGKTAKKQEDFDADISIRQYFYEAGKKKYTEKSAKGVQAFLKSKKIDKLFSDAVILLKELNSLYDQLKKAQTNVETDKISISEMKKIQKSLKSKGDRLLDQFDKKIEELNEKEERKKEGKKKFNDFNEKKQKIYEQLKEASPNNGSCDDKDCGYNNCLTLAMKIASGKDNFDSCPFIENDDEDDEDSPSSKCFITTAVCKALGRKDDCYELNAFRAFRDNWLLKQRDGKIIVDEYYRIAPKIIAAIDKVDKRNHVYINIWKTYLAECLNLIEAENYAECKTKYTEMVEELQTEWLGV